MVKLGDYIPMAKHIHRFQRRTIGKDKDYIVYACVLPSCFTYYPEDMIVGKESLCNRCKENVFVIKKNSSSKIPHKPHCKECTLAPRNPELRKKPAKRVHRLVVEDITKMLLD